MDCWIFWTANQQEIHENNKKLDERVEKYFNLNDFWDFLRQIAEIFFLFRCVIALRFLCFKNIFSVSIIFAPS